MTRNFVARLTRAPIKAKLFVSILCLALIGVVYTTALLQRNVTKSTSYSALIDVYESIEIGMDVASTSQLLQAHSEQFRYIRDGYPKPFSDEIRVEMDALSNGLIEIHTFPMDVFARNRVMGIQIDNGKVTAVMIRTADSRRYHPDNAPADKIGVGVKIEGDWVPRKPELN